jgi:hypothetical protein
VGASSAVGGAQLVVDVVAGDFCHGSDIVLDLHGSVLNSGSQGNGDVLDLVGGLLQAAQSNSDVGLGDAGSGEKVKTFGRDPETNFHRFNKNEVYDPIMQKYVKKLNEL